MIVEPPLFDPAGDLPWGQMTIEASAGTGKTHTLCQLVVRYIAEAGVPASAFLIVTFTRAATAELRGRIRKAIVDRINTLEAGPHDLDPQQVATQVANLRRAVTEYDTITVTTIHSFATQTLGSLGSISRFDPPSSFADENDETIRAACSDAILRAAANGVDVELQPKIADLVGVVKTARSSPDIVIEPSEPGDEPTAEEVLAELVRDVLFRLREQRLSRGAVSFDDVLTSLRDTINSSSSTDLVHSLRNRYRVVMIDEFQDTDPIQWAIFGQVFGSDVPASTSARGSGSADRRSLILVGDPKQSIYAFRGADISTYTAAVSSSGMERVALKTNWRSDGQVLRALGSLLSGTTYGNGIGFVPVGAPSEHDERHALDGGTPIAPLHVRLALGDDIKRTAKAGTIEAEASREAIWADVVERVHHTLRHVQIPTKYGDHRPALPSDIAILVKAGWQALDVQRLLIESGVPAVLSRAGKVLESPAAQQWRWLLDALASPADARRARRFALGWFRGMTPDELDTADEATMTALFEQLRAWLEELRGSGVVTFVQRVFDDSGVIPRLLRHVDGDRSVTDLLHVGEILGTSSEGRTPTINSLLDAIQTRSGEGGMDQADEYARRVETEDPAVQVMTIWVSKGLEFPIVMVPTLYTDANNSFDVIVDDGTRRIFDVSGKAADPERRNLARQRRVDESLRVAYVALTRASHQTTVWWGTSNYSDKSALSRIIFARDGDGAIDHSLYVAEKVPIPKDSSGIDAIRPLLERSEGLVTAKIIGAAPRRRRERAPSRSGDHGPGGRLDARGLTELPDRSTGRWSFTAITNAEATHANPEDLSLGDFGASDEHQPSATSPGDGTTIPVTEPDQMGPTNSGTEASGATHDTKSIPLGWLPAGARFGTLVHAVYERIDFTDPDIAMSIGAVIDQELSWQQLDLVPPLLKTWTDIQGRGLLVEGITRTLRSPLGPLFAGRTLDSIGLHDRLSELSFEFLLGRTPTDGVATVGHAVSDRAIGDLLCRWLGDDDPLRSWAEQIAEGRFGVDLAGHMTGSIDAIFRVDRDGRPRFIISDYKTNRLSQAGDTPEPMQYGTDAMTEAMTHHHYPLQALIYSVTLHRYLRSRLSDYDPDVHLGGVAYLFVRGMVGTDAPVIGGHPTGVWSWQPPSGLVLGFSDLLTDLGPSTGSVIAGGGI